MLAFEPAPTPWSDCVGRIAPAHQASVLASLCAALVLAMRMCVRGHSPKPFLALQLRPVLRYTSHRASAAIMSRSAQTPTTAATPPSSSKTLPRSSPAKKITYSIPAPARTGNKQTDDMLQSQFICLEACFADLANIPELRAPTFNFMQNEKKKLEQRKGIDNSATLLNDASTFTAVDEKYKIQYIASKSDMSSADLSNVMMGDSASLNDMFMFALQLPMKSRLPPQLMVQDVMTRFLDERYSELGARLANFKKDGGVAGSTASFQNSHGCYQLTFSADKKLLTEVAHISGDKVAVDEKLNLGQAYTLHDNFDDHAACLALPPLPNIKLAQFFDSRRRTGPYKVQGYHGKPKLLEEKAMDHYHAWEDEEEGRNKHVDFSTKVVQEVSRHRQEISKENMKRARENAMQALAKKKARRTIALSA